MSLGFLTIASKGPVARSPLADRSFDDATLERRGDWDIVIAYGDPDGESRACRETVGWADLSHLAKYELRGDSSWLSELALGDAERRGDGWVCPITGRRGLLIGETGTPGDGSILDLTSSLAAISVAGPRARETIARFCAIDTRAEAFPSSCFRPGSVARTPGYLLHEEGDRFLLIFGAAYGAYVWDVVADAGMRLGGRPVGLPALERTEPVREELIADA